MKEKANPEVPLPTIEQVEAERQHLKERRAKRQKFRNTSYVILGVAAVAVIVAMLFVSVLQVTGDSMEPTLKDGDIIVVAKTNAFETGDLLAFYYENKILLKRVIGLPGDYIDINEEGTVYLNGEALDEPYIREKSLGHSDIAYPYKVPDGQMFVLGDDRAVSIDSRSKVIGTVDRDKMLGRVLFRLGNVKS